jgi:CSLREA domain-containing protein
MHGRPLAATLAALIALASPAAALAATFTVNGAGDQADLPSAGCDVDDVAPGPQCTLRAAIQAANLDAVRDGIVFAIKAATVTPATALPAITQPVIVDGSGEDAIADPALTIDGAGTAGLAVAGAGGTTSGTGTQIFGVRLTGFAGSALTVTGSYALLQHSVVDGNGGAGAAFGAGGLGRSAAESTPARGTASPATPAPASTSARAPGR